MSESALRPDQLESSEPPELSADAGGAEAPTAELADAYAELQSLLLETQDLTDFLDQVAALAGKLTGGHACGITIRRGNEMSTIAHSGQLASQVDEIQYTRGEGPCLDALESGHVILVEDLASEDRWPDFRIHALAYGVRSSLSVPLVVNDDIRGALNLYGDHAGLFTKDLVLHSEAFGRQATVALAIMLHRADQSRLEGQLREALATRAVIDQALGIIMGQQRMNSREAFAVLREASQARNRKLSDVAADLIETVTGQPPLPPRPFNEPRS